MNMKKISVYVLVALILIQFHPSPSQARKKYKWVQQCVSIPPPALPTIDVQASKVSFGNIEVQGDGCSASSTAAPDQSALSILFDEFSVRAGGASGKRQDRKRCLISVPIDVPSGMSVTIVKADTRGFYDLPSKKTEIRFSSQYSIEDHLGIQTGSSIQKTIKGPLSEPFLFSLPEKPLTSRCGGTMTLRLDTQISVFSKNEETFAGVDSIDLDSRHDGPPAPGTIFHLTVRPCNTLPDPQPTLVCKTVKVRKKRHHHFLWW